MLKFVKKNIKQELKFTRDKLKLELKKLNKNPEEYCHSGYLAFLDGKIDGLRVVLDFIEHSELEIKGDKKC